MALGRLNRGGREENPNLGTRSALQNGEIEELEMMQMFSSRKQEPPPPPTPMEKPRPAVAPDQSNRAPEPKRSGGILSRGVSIKGTVKFNNELLIDGEVEGRIQSSGLLTIGEHARIKGEIRSKAVYLRGNVEGNIFATERCELQAGCTLKGDIEAPRFVVDEHATFLGSAKVGTPK
jgi:cytoskeletal protein CcmA (bactofilin family)